MRSIAAAADRRTLELMERHALTLLSLAPELERVIFVSEALARSFTFSREGNSRFWTLRLAHGLSDFLLSCFAGRSPSPARLSFENVHAADPLDQEFISVLLRRADPDELSVTVGSASEELPEPLISALRSHARLTWARAATSGAETSAEQVQERASTPSDQRAHAERYVASDCTADDVMASSAYALCPPSVRRELHEARAAFLESVGERSLTLGAIPLHREQAGSGLLPLVVASAYCMRMGYYDASLDLARRGLSVLDSEPSAEHGERGELARNVLFSLLLLDRLDEVVAYCREIASTSRDPALNSHGAYAMAILYARAYPEEKRDYEAARRYVLEALSFTGLLPASETRTVNLVFLRNTLALVEMRVGRPDLSLELLTEGLERLEREAPAKGERESVILLHNRARIHVVLGDISNAVRDYTTLLAREPSNSEAHMDRGILYQRVGRLEEALDDYEAAITWSPPYDEAHFNRAQALSALGRSDAAIDAYSSVLRLEPAHRGALINRAGLLFAAGRHAEARRDVERVLSPGSADPKAWCLLGLVEMAAGRYEDAFDALGRAIDLDGAEVSAWTNRATVRVQLGDLDGALGDLDEALRVREDPTARSNRVRVVQLQTDAGSARRK